MNRFGWMMDDVEIVKRGEKSAPQARVWDESLHPRDPGGEGGGQFISSGGAAGGASEGREPTTVPLKGSVGHPALISSRLASAKGVDQSIYRQPSVEAQSAPVE